MFKLFINHLQVGNYKTYQEMVTSLVMNYCPGKTCTSMCHAGKSLFISFA